MNKEIRVYIASPYTLGYGPTMVNLQIVTADKLIDEGYIPYTPVLAHFQEIYKPRSEYDWLKIDFCFLKCCDALIRLFPLDENGKEIPSNGADQEEALANENNIPVFYSIEELNNYFEADN